MIGVKEQQSLSLENFLKLEEIKASEKEMVVSPFIDHWIERTLK